MYNTYISSFISKNKNPDGGNYPVGVSLSLSFKNVQKGDKS
nr:hypothetical protein [Vibrio alginolyticus]